jgi:hypothetical protein
VSATAARHSLGDVSITFRMRKRHLGGRKPASCSRSAPMICFPRTLIASWSSPSCRPDSSFIWRKYWGSQHGPLEKREKSTHRLLASNSWTHDSQSS